jgi:hypothetical protein
MTARLQHHHPRQRDRAHEVSEIVGQGVQPKPRLVVAGAGTGKPCPVGRVLAFLDVLLTRPALIVAAKPRREAENDRELNILSPELTEGMMAAVTPIGASAHREWLRPRLRASA